jgi:hypothetical protein
MILCRLSDIGGRPVHRFVAHQNIERFRRLLETVSGAKARQAILELLEAEIDKLPLEERLGELSAFHRLSGVQEERAP